MSGFLNEETMRFQTLPCDPEDLAAYRERLRANEQRRMADQAACDLVARLSVRGRQLLGTCLPAGAL